MTKEILILSDLHVMSLWGLMPPNFEAEDPKTGNMIQYPQNETQVALWNHWSKMLDTVNPEIIIINGDVCDGPAKRNYGNTVVSSNLLWQVDAATQVINTLPDVPKYFTLGTEYHSYGDTGMSLEQMVSREVGGIYGDDLLIEECGIRIHASHNVGVSTSAWMYRPSGISRDLMLMVLNSADDKYGICDLIIKSHAHYFVSVQFSHMTGLVSPCWQVRTPFAVKKNLISPTDIGWITANVRGNGSICLDRRGLTHIGTPCKVVGRENVTDNTSLKYGDAYTFEEEKFIRENYGVLRTQELARKLNRSQKAVMSKIKRMRLTLEK